MPQVSPKEGVPRQTKTRGAESRLLLPSVVVCPRTGTPFVATSFLTILLFWPLDLSIFRAGPGSGRVEKILCYFRPKKSYP
jgi:hypothetical protein